MTALGIRPDARRRLSAPRIAEIVADELRRQIIDGELGRRRSAAPSGSARRAVQRQPGLPARSAADPGNRGAGLGPARQPRRRRRARAGEDKRRLHAGSAVAERVSRRRRSRARRCRNSNPPARHWRPSGPTAPTPSCRTQRVNDAMAEHLEDGPEFTEIGRQFHDSVVRGCGNHTIIAVVGSLETLWTSHEQQWADESAAMAPTRRWRNVAPCSTRTSSWPR